MILKWSKKDLPKDIEYIKNGEAEFVDVRGKISNHELTEPINLIGLIDSKKGTMRANHYHPQQEQKCLFTKGQIIEIFQEILNLLLDLSHRQLTSLLTLNACLFRRESRGGHYRLDAPSTLPFWECHSRQKRGKNIFTRSVRY